MNIIRTINRNVNKVYRSDDSIMLIFKCPDFNNYNVVLLYLFLRNTHWSVYG